jgi:hypothetical protein
MDPNRTKEGFQKFGVGDDFNNLRYVLNGYAERGTFGERKEARFALACLNRLERRIDCLKTGNKPVDREP